MGTSFFLMNTSRLTSLKGVKCYMRIIYPTYHYPALEPKTVETGSLNFIIFFFFLSGFSFTDTDNSQDSRGREGTIFYSTLPLPPAHEHWHIYLQLCMWDDYHVFLIATLVFTRLLLDEIYHLIELPFEWLIDDAMFVCLLDELILGFCYSDFDMGNRWIWTRIDYHPCITSEQTDQVWVSQVAVTIMQTR